MTREQATQNIDDCDFLDWQIDIIEDMLGQIFNDHEAQLKKCIELGEKQALEFDRFFDAFGLKSENISIDDAINFFKAKDEEIERLKEAISTSIEEIEYAIKKTQYAEDYLGNAIRFLKDTKGAIR